MNKIKLPSLEKLRAKSLDEQLRWVEKQTEKLIDILPTLKKELMMYDEKSNEVYMQEPTEIQLISNVYQQEISEGKYTKGTQEFIEDLEYYTETPLQTIIEETTEYRIEDFKLSLRKAGANLSEIEYVERLLNKMTDEQKRAFTRSKFFWTAGVVGSEGLIDFHNKYGVTPATANLENWCNINGIEIENRYVDKSTYRKRGRPRTRKKK